MIRSVLIQTTPSDELEILFMEDQIVKETLITEVIPSLRIYQWLEGEN